MERQEIWIKHSSRPAIEKLALIGFVRYINILTWLQGFRSDGVFLEETWQIWNFSLKASEPCENFVRSNVAISRWKMVRELKFKVWNVSNKHLFTEVESRKISTTFIYIHVYHTSWITSGPKSNFYLKREAILVFFSCSEVNSTPS